MITQAEKETANQARLKKEELENKIKEASPAILNAAATIYAAKIVKGLAPCDHENAQNNSVSIAKKMFINILGK